MMPRSRAAWSAGALDDAARGPGSGPLATRRRTRTALQDTRDGHEFSGNGLPPTWWNSSRNTCTRPLARPMMALVRTATRLQSGRLDADLAYMPIALIAILAVVAAWADLRCRPHQPVANQG